MANLLNNRLQQVAFGNLVERNKQSEDSVASSGEDKVKLRLPFIVVNTRKRTSVDCWMSSNRCVTRLLCSGMFDTWL